MMISEFKPKPDPYNLTKPFLLGSEYMLSKWLARIQIGSLEVQFPSGIKKIFAGNADGPSAKINIHKINLVRRLIISGDIGLAESFMAEEWDTPDLTTLIRLGELNERALGSAATPSKLMRVFNRIRHGWRSNSREGSRKNIAAHYDLGNGFYSNWLDSSMSYSSGLFHDLTVDHEVAQRNKYLRLAEQLDLKEGQTILEIGCGWGGFAEYLGKNYDVKLDCITISKKQFEYAKERIHNCGLNEKVNIEIKDYRDLKSKYNSIASIEMIEAVGQNYLESYFKTIKDNLSDGGKAAIQAITIDDSLYDRYRNKEDFIQKYIFPGGFLPNKNTINKLVSKNGLSVNSYISYADHYADTLAIWRDEFNKKWSLIKEQGFDLTFKRMWEFYLSYCEAGFKSKNIDLIQFSLQNK